MTNKLKYIINLKRNIYKLTRTAKKHHQIKVASQAKLYIEQKSRELVGPLEIIDQV